MIGLVTDSNAQLPPELAQRFGVEIVPLTVTVDGTPYLEGEEMGADDFYSLFESATPAVATSQPSPGRLARAYRSMAGRGAREILSVHVGSSVSGTVNAARLAAEMSPVPVRVVDTGTVSFGVACCLWEAADAVARGASAEEAAAVAEGIGALMGNVFVVGALDLARAGGRLAPGSQVPDGAGIPVLRMEGGVMEVVGRARDVGEAADALCSAVRAAASRPGPRLRVGIGVADRATAPLGDALEHRLGELPEVADVVRYRVGPSVGAHTGPGTVGAMFYPSPSADR